MHEGRLHVAGSGQGRASSASRSGHAPCLSMRLRALAPGLAMSLRTAVRRVIIERFPWIERIGLTSAGDLEIKSATGKIELAGGDAAVHRVGDDGSGGRFDALANVVTYTSPQGKSWTMTFASASPITITIVPIPPTTLPEAGNVDTRATTGSGKVSSG